MAGSYLITLVAITSDLASVYGLKCHEGIDMTVSGIPMYFWNQRECVGESKCIRQGITFSTNLAGIKLDTSMQYGACMSSAYSDYLDCENLFGKDSNFNPANILDMIPGIDQSVTNAAQVFSWNTAISMKELLSNGTGIVSFVDGVFIFYDNLGFNLDKAVPLKPSLVKLLTTVIDGSPSDLVVAVGEFLNDFGQLDTENAEFAGAIHSLLTNLGVDLNAMQTQAPFATVLIERGPGLLRSTLPSNWKIELWYDVVFKLVGNVDIKNWTKSTEDMVATIRSSYVMPPDVAQYIIPILDALPDLARGSAVAPTYVGRWSLELLKKFSEADNATEEFSAALNNFIQTLTGAPLQYEYMLTIKWMPGLFYKFFPGDKAVIQEVYTKMAAGLKTYNPLSVEASSAPETKLSMMIGNLVQKLGGFQLLPQFKGLVVSLSHMFYELMKVNAVDYTNYVDDFATVIDDGFKDMPNINVGTIITNLITKMGGEVPAELKPLLSYIQPLITVTTTQPMNAVQVHNAMKDIVSSYKSSFPSSPFPELVERFLVLIFRLMATNNLTPIEEKNNINLEFQFWNIDLQFAIIKTYNLESDELYRMLAKAWPEYHLYIRILKAMDPEDVKQLIKDIIQYYSKDTPRTTEGFVNAVKPTFMKITQSIKGLMGEMRQWFAPNTCKFTSCANEDLCNTRLFVSSQEPLRRNPAATLAPLTTSAGSSPISTNVLLNIVTLWIASKMFR